MSQNLGKTLLPQIFWAGTPMITFVKRQSYFILSKPLNIDFKFSFLGKIIVKGKRLPSESNIDGEVSNEDEAADIEQEGGKKEKSQVSHRELSRFDTLR